MGGTPLTAKLICLNAITATWSAWLTNSRMDLTVPEQVRILVANVLYCWALKNHVLLVAHHS